MFYGEWGVKFVSGTQRKGTRLRKRERRLMGEFLDLRDRKYTASWSNIFKEWLYVLNIQIYY